jgi:hypothetical protein
VAGTAADVRRHEVDIGNGIIHLKGEFQTRELDVYTT